MKLIRGLHNLNPQHRGCVAGIGNFDGVHRGHQQLIKQLTTKAKELGLPATLITFEPQPREYFTKHKVPPRLTRLREKIEAIATYGIDQVLIINFKPSFEQLTAQDFIRKVLVDGLGVKHLVVGDDFRFGYQRQGDIQLLQQYGESLDFSVEQLAAVAIDDVRISSSAIRQALQNGEMALAQALLGRPYSMSGRVAHGEKLGRQLGFPTANIQLHRKVSPLQGVFTVAVHGLGQTPINGVANIGTRPAVGGTRTLLEVYLLDFEQDIYGKAIQVDFLSKLRDEANFESLELLRQAISQDAEQARAYFASCLASA